MFLRFAALIILMSITAFSQTPPIEPGVSHTLAKWRAARYSDVRYKINLTLEKMSPVLKGTMEIRVNVGTRTPSSAMPASAGEPVPIILDWRKIKVHGERAAVSNVSINGKSATLYLPLTAVADEGVRVPFEESSEHLIFRDGVVLGENVITLDFTSPILTSGSAITRYVDKEDGAEYIYSLFVPSDASTAFPVFDQPDLKARFTLNISTPDDWQVVSNTFHTKQPIGAPPEFTKLPGGKRKFEFAETKPISTYVSAFAAGPWGQFTDLEKEYGMIEKIDAPVETRVFVRKSQYVKASDHIAEVFRLNREAVKYLEGYFDYKFPFPKYDIVLIPEFPFGGMEHAGATFLRESSVIFPQEPTKNDYVSRANLIFHEAAHQWFGDTVTMKWFDDLWLKEGFAEFMAYKTLEKVMPEYNAWKIFYERNKQAAYLTDSTRGTTPIYQEIANLNAAKSAYGNIVYRKAPSFLKQAEFYIGPDKFQTAVRGFLKKHEFKNAEWTDLVKEFELASNQDLKKWAEEWVTIPGVTVYRFRRMEKVGSPVDWLTWLFVDAESQTEGIKRPMAIEVYEFVSPRRVKNRFSDVTVRKNRLLLFSTSSKPVELGFFPNYQDYGYGIFLLDDKSRDYVLKNIHNEKDDFLRTMMWGSLWDSVREAELDPKQYVELVIKVQSAGFSPSERDKSRTLNAGETDESTIQTLLGRVSTAMTYYLPDTQRNELAPKIEAILIDRMKNAPTLGLRITYYRAFLNIASTENARNVLRTMLRRTAGTPAGDTGKDAKTATAEAASAGKLPAVQGMPAFLKTKDRFDIITKLLILGDKDAPALLADLEKAETSDEAKRYAYAAKAGIATAENKAKYWNDFTNNKTISESWIEAAFGPFNSVRHADLTLPYLEKALNELPNHKRNRKIFFVNGWLAAFIGGQRSEQALGIVNKFLADNPKLDKDLRLKILENVDLIERGVKIRMKFKDR